MPTLEGSVENIVFRNEDNHYTVARFRPKDSGRLFRDDLMTIVGMLPGIHVGELLKVEGEWEKDPRYGRQLHVTSFIQRLPASPEGIIRYLSSGLIKGIGPKKATLIVEHFGEQTLAIIEQQPERLSEVKGISAKDRDQITKSWIEQSEIKELHLFLQSHDVSMNVATRIYKQYGQESIKVIRENPYQLAEDVHGIGFRTADDIAVKLGLPQDSVPRLASGLKYVLAQAANEDGHCFLPEGELLTRAATILHAPSDEGIKGSRLIVAALERLQQRMPIEFVLVKGLPHAEAMQLYQRADLVIDQVLAGWYGGFAVEAMAMGKPVACYIREADLCYIPETMRAELPFIRLTPETIEADVAAALARRAEWPQWGQQARAFVLRWHHPRRLAEAMIRAYQDPLSRFYLESV